MTYRHPESNANDLGRINNYGEDIGFAGEVSLTDEVTVSFPNLAAHGGAITVGDLSPGPFGNNVITDTNCAVHGYDWLGQPMSEEIAIGAGAKAFKKVTSITDGASCTWGDEYGLPYKTTTSGDVGDGVITAADTTDPATINTGDPRGTVDFDAEPDGATDKSVVVTVAAPYHGVQQFSDPDAVYTA